MSNHEKTLKAFVSLLSMEKGVSSSNSQSFSQTDRCVAGKSTQSSWALNGFLKSFSSGGNVQLLIPSLSVIPPSDESKVFLQGDDLKSLTNNIIRTMQSKQCSDMMQNPVLGHTNAQLLHNFSRRIVFSSGDRNSSSDTTLRNDILTTPDVLNENLVTSIRYLFDSRMKYFIASITRKKVISKSKISKSVSSLLSLEVNNKAPTELDDQNLIEPFIDAWEHPNNLFMQGKISNNHQCMDGQSTSFQKVKRKHGELDTLVDNGRATNDNDFPFDVTDRVRKFTTRITSSSISFELPKGTTNFLQSESTNHESISHTSTNTPSSTCAFNTNLVCLPIMLVAKATVDVSIKHALKVNIAFSTNGTIQGKFSGDLLEEVEVFIDTKELFDNMTNQVKLSIKKAIALLLTTTYTSNKGSKSSSVEAQKSSKQYPETTRNNGKGLLNENSKRSMSLQKHTRTTNTYPASSAPTKRASAPNIQHSLVHPTFDLNQMSLLNNGTSYSGNSPNVYNNVDLHQMNNYAPNRYVIEEVNSNQRFCDAYFPGYTDGYVVHANGLLTQQSYVHGGFNTHYNIDYNCTHLPYSTGSDPRSFSSSAYFPDVTMGHGENRMNYSVQNVNRYPLVIDTYRQSQSDMNNIPMATSLTHGPAYAVPNASKFGVQTDLGRSFTHQDLSFPRPEPVRRRNSIMGTSFIAPDMMHRMQLGEPAHNEIHGSPTSMMKTLIKPCINNNQQHLTKRRYSGSTIPPKSHSKTTEKWKEEKEQFQTEKYNCSTHREFSDIPLSSEYAYHGKNQKGSTVPKPQNITSSEMDPFKVLKQEEIRPNDNHKHLSVTDKATKNGCENLPRRRSSFPIESILAAVNLARISEQDEAVSEDSTPSDIKRRRSSNGAAYAAIVRFLEEEERSKGGDSEISIDTVAEFSRLIEFEEMLRRSSAPAMLSAAETVRRWEFENALDRRDSEVSASAAMEVARFLTSAERRRGSLGPHGMI